MKKISLIAILTSIMIMAASVFCFAEGGFELVSSYPEDGQTNTSMENLGVKLTFSNAMDSAEATAANADKFTIYDEDYEIIECSICKTNGTKGYGIKKSSNNKRIDWKYTKNAYYES